MLQPWFLQNSKKLFCVAPFIPTNHSIEQNSSLVYVWAVTAFSINYAESCENLFKEGYIFSQQQGSSIETIYDKGRYFFRGESPSLWKEIISEVQISLNILSFDGTPIVNWGITKSYYELKANSSKAVAIVTCVIGGIIWIVFMIVIPVLESQQNDDDDIY